MLRGLNVRPGILSNKRGQQPAHQGLRFSNKMNRLLIWIIGSLMILQLIRGQDTLVLKEKWKDTLPQRDEDTLVFYYFGASWCGPCNQPEMVKAISEVKEKLGKQY